MVGGGLTQLCGQRRGQLAAEGHQRGAWLFGRTFALRQCVDGPARVFVEAADALGQINVFEGPILNRLYPHAGTAGNHQSI